MSRFKILRSLMARHRYQLILTYVLFSLEMLGKLMRPFLIGIAIDGLVKGSYNGVILLSVVHCCWMLVGMIRQRYDTRAYSRIYTSLVTQFLSRRYGKQEVSKLSAHSTLAREFVDFLEFDQMYVIEAAYYIFGSLFFLFHYDKLVVSLCLLILVPVMIVSHFYGKKMKWLNRMKNDELEKQVDVIASGSKGAIKSHYNSLRKWQIRISDQEAWSFGFTEMMVMLVIGGSLLIAAKVGHQMVTAGAFVGIVGYIGNFVSGLDTIPYTIQRLSFLNDIVRRIELQTEDFGEDQNTGNNEQGELFLFPIGSKSQLPTVA